MLGYIHDIIKVSSFPSNIDDTDELFLFYILEGLTNAYQIFSKLKGENVYRAYKNVHRRIKKLFESNLIEEVKTESGFKHGARNYRLTTRGLVYIFSELGTPYSTNIFLPYLENVLFRTLLYPCFERSTIKSATYSLSRLIGNYLEECCRTTRYTLEEMTDYVNPAMESRELLDSIPIKILQYQLNWHIKSFILKAAILTEDLIDWRNFAELSTAKSFSSTGKLRCIANDRVDTLTLLSGDKKFMKALEEIEGQFSKGYDKLIELKNKKKSK
jgi:hypothetical protein